MNLNTLDKIKNIFSAQNEITLDSETIIAAKKSINRMIDFEDQYFSKNQRAS